MTTKAEELLDSLTTDDIMPRSAKEEGHIIIQNDRFITVPDGLKKIAVQYDHNIETVTFDCPRYWDNNDMSKMKIYINYILPDGNLGSCIADNITIDSSDDNIMHFNWTISRNVTQLKGNISFIVCIKKTDDDGNEINHWNSELNNDLYVSEGLECSETVLEQYQDIITQLLTKMDNILLVNTPILDKSLSIPGLAADAGETGKRISLNRTRIDNIIANSSATDGNSELIDIRTGYDDIIYDTAGEAVREQIGELKRDLGELEEFTNRGVLNQKIYANFHIKGNLDNNEYPDESVWREEFQTFKNAGLDGYVIGFDIQPIAEDQIAYENGEKTEDELTYFCYPDKIHVREIIQLGKEYGLELHACKFHNLYMKQHHTELTFSTWFTKYKTVIIDQLNDLKNRGLDTTYKIISILNESAKYGINDSPNDSNVRAFIDTLKTKYPNKLIGISGCIDADTRKNYLDKYQKLDILMPFAYPPISAKRENTTYEDSISAWEYSKTLKYINSLSTAYTDIPIIICETGCKNYYDSLIQPESSDYYTGELIQTGEPFSIFLIGLLELSKENKLPGVSEIWLYYTDDLYTHTQELIKRYKNGWGHM